MYDLVIIGGGPAGVGAGIYAARKKMKTLVIAKDFGGQSIVSEEIQNWIGTQAISGLELAKMFEGHLRKYQKQGDVDISLGDLVASVKKINNGFSIKTTKGKTLKTAAVLVASGSRRRRLGVPGEDRLDGKGVAWCGTCDAPLFKGRAVAVVGGGNSGLETVLNLAPYAKQIFIIQRSDRLRGDPITQEKVKKLKSVKVIFNAETKEILGDKLVSGLRYKDKIKDKEKVLDVQGVFVEVGSVPNSDFLGDLVNKNDFGEIAVDHKTQMSSLPGIWAAGDVSDVLYKQNNISVGDAIKAVLNIFDYLHRRSVKKR